MHTRPVLVAGCLLISACSSAATPARSPARTPATTAPSSAVSLSPLAAPLAVVPGPTIGTSFTVEEMALKAGDSVSIAMHPSPEPISLRASASMPLAACPDSDSRSGLGLGWSQGQRFGGCHPITPDSWLQLPSTHTGSQHVSFRVTAQRGGTIRSLEVSYQRVDPFLLIETTAPALSAASVVSTPKGEALAAGVSGLFPGNDSTSAVGAVSVSQSGSRITRTGACPTPSEFDLCFLGITAGLPVTVRVLHAPPTPLLILDADLP